jgi:hypothetical protein
MSEQKVNNAKRFFLRGLGLIPKKESLNKCGLTQLGLVDVYLKDDNHETNILHPLYLLFKPKEMGLFNMFVENSYLEGDLKEDYDYPDGYVMLLYEFPKEFKKDYETIVKGEYSKVSTKYKNLFPEEDPDGTPILAYQIFTKGDLIIEKRMEELNLDYWEDDWELWEKIDIQKETFNYERLQESLSKSV